MRVGNSVSGVVVLLATIAIVLTVDELPERVASHFGVDGRATGFMSRDTYRIAMLALVLGLPLAVRWGAVRALYRTRTAGVRIPNAEYWLAPGRREATLSFIAHRLCWLAVGIALYVLAIHLALIRANVSDPPLLAGNVVVGLLIVPLIAAVLWAFGLTARFRAVDSR